MERKDYETVIGLEVHIQLNTKSKIFCGDSTYFGAKPNTLVSAISLAHPGTLPKINEAVIPKAIKLGLALNSEINRNSTFDRKSYFYADLPKGYQITQDKNPILIGGRLRLEDGSEINIHHVHLEEDAGKSIHHLDPTKSLLDYNRAGTPLLELVTEPDFRSGEQVEQFLYSLRQLIRYIDISDGNMEQGSMRCDVNISIRHKGDQQYNNRCEVKNVNSMKFAKQAISFEAKRQIAIMEAGETVAQNTLNFNPETGETSPLRSKENATDYRYFPDPDLPPVLIAQELIYKLEKEMPRLPWVLAQDIKAKYGISDVDTHLLVAEKETANYFLDYAQQYPHAKSFANVLIHKLLPLCKEKNTPLSELLVSHANLAAMLDMVSTNKLSIGAATQKLLPEMVLKPETAPSELAAQLGIVQSSNSDELEIWIGEVIAEFPSKVTAYQQGKKGLIGFFMGEIMKRSKGKANPKKTKVLLSKKLEL